MKTRTILVSIHAALLAYCAFSFSPTTDEPGHLVAGISHWRLRQYDLFRITPPLARMAGAVPVMALADDPQWREVSRNYRVKTHTYVGRDFVSANRDRFCFLLTVARLVCIPFSAIGLLVCFFWGRDLFGPRAGFLAATLWCFDPNILAHGSLITPDIAATSLGAWASYTFWRWLRSPTWRLAVAAGAILGLTGLSSYAALFVLYPILLISWVVYRFTDRKIERPTRWGREGAMLIVCGLVALYAINLGYGFEDTMQPLSQFTFQSEVFTGETTLVPGNRFRESWFESMRMPLPANYLTGIDQCLCDLQYYHKPSYLAGEWSQTGWWYYYLYAMSMKLPLGSIALILTAFVTALFRGTTLLCDNLVLLMPAAGLLMFVSSQSGYSEHMRFALPVLPFLFIWASQLARPVPRPQDHGESHRIANTVQTRMAAALITWMILSSLCIYPHCLSYFNEFAGGPMQGHQYLLGSNIDWGQDLMRLKSYLDRNHPNDSCFLAYEETVYPKDLGIIYSHPQSAPNRLAVESLPPGVYAISVTYLCGMPFLASRQADTQQLTDVRNLRGFLQWEPTATCGYSIYVYVVE